MECPHLKDSVKIECPVQSEKEVKEWLCAECSTTLQPWICLHCGVVNCGRYANGHAMIHSQNHTNHNVCMECESLSVYCYSCNDFVINDTQDALIGRLREIMIASDTRHSDSWTNCDVNSSTATNQTHHNLRPRTRRRYTSERSHSNDSSSTGSTENIRCSKRGRQKKKMNNNSHRKTQKPEKKVVGLRNLGNTCFMNAVLQSLSNIQEFCLYFKQLPSLEGLKNGRNKMYQSRALKELKDAIMAEELRKVLINLSDQGAKGAISPESLFLVIWKVVPRYRAALFAPFNNDIDSTSDSTDLPNNGHLNPLRMERLPIKGYQQQDAHEFLRYMLDRLHTELLHVLPDFTLKDSTYISHRNKISIVTSIFGGTLQSEVQCLNCGTESKKLDPFLDLSLDIPDSCISQRKSKETGENIPPCNILDCLTSFIEVEELAETELYHCNHCKSKQRSTKRFWIRRLPNVLCLHLKRFRWNNFFRTKVDIHITFPVVALDMSQFVLNDYPDTRRSSTYLYDLAAVIVHHGGGSGCGHYTAFAIHDGRWFHFNDSSVKPIESDVVAKCKPYILFYIRREFRFPTVKS